MKKTGLDLAACGILLASMQALSSCMDGAPGQNEYAGENTMFSVKALQADFNQFRKFLEESHPQLYRFTSKQTFDSLFEVHSRMIDDSMTTQESPVATGSQIISVNGMDARYLLEEMLGNIWSDGFIKTNRYRRLNSLFPYLYALNYGYPRQFKMVYIEEDMEKQINLEPLSRLFITAYRDSLVNSGTIRREDLIMELKDEQTALLTIRTFAYYDDNKGFNKFIDSSFQVIQDHKIQNLIIDLRGNDGGDPFCSSHLLAYLQKKPVIYFRQPYGRYARLNKPLPIAEKPFKGSQYYLIDGMCFSTTGHITSLLKYYGFGTFIGEETGATYTCNDASHDTRLKHTGYRLQSARASFATAVTGFRMDQGIQPDFPVRQSIDEVIHNHDAVLEFTLALIKQKNSK